MASVGAQNVSLITQDPGETAPVVGLVGGGTTAQRPSSPPLYFHYFDTDLGTTVVWNGIGWVAPIGGAQGPQGNPGPTGAQGPQGSSGSGVVDWSAITNKPTLFDILNSNFGGGNDGFPIGDYDRPGGFISFKIGFQITWFMDVPRTAEGIYVCAMPRTVGKVLMVYGIPNLNPVLWTNQQAGDSWVQILNWNSSQVQYGIQNGNTNTGLVPINPTFLVLSNLLG
jgi:hypothetical protein